MDSIIVLLFILTWGLGDLYTTKIGYDIGHKNRKHTEWNPILNMAFKYFGFHSMTIMKSMSVIIILYFFINDNNTLLFGVVIGSLAVLWNSLQIYRYTINNKRNNDV